MELFPIIFKFTLVNKTTTPQVSGVKANSLFALYKAI
jgi:hypothetical protein